MAEGAAPAQVAAGSAPARVALAGNPSDGYGGAVLALTVDALQAHVRIADHALARVAGDAAARTPPQLVAATVARFAREFGGEAATHAPTLPTDCDTAIPRSVGLGGSSAIVIATLRALSQRFGVPLAPLELAEIALAVEVEDLGIAAGPQDRIAQAFGGLTFMDFTAARYESLDPAHLPPLLVAWRASAAAASGPVHDDLRGRFDRGEPVVLRALSELAGAAHEARAAVIAGDHESLARATDVSFDARASMLELDPRHVELVALARDAGASANYAGSGGAIVCVCRDEDTRADARRALELAGCETLPA
ncbi:MAG: GHMP family kinase ATP-binding protein [Solirubrobacteraceae bacterium]